MSGQGHILIEGATLTLARRLPVRWDVRCEAHLRGANLSRRRLAVQVRQDIWRACQRVRGFVPLVAVTPVEGGYQISAGATLAVRSAPRSVIAERLQQVLDAPERHQRWRNFATRQGCAA